MSPALHQLLHRINHLTPSGAIGDGTIAQLQELASRVRAEHLASLLEEEWSGESHGQGLGPHGSGDGGAVYPACPECGGLQRPNGEFVQSAVGHRSGCTIAAALGRPTVVEPGETGRLAL